MRWFRREFLDTSPGCEVCGERGLLPVTCLGVRMVECPKGHTYVPAPTSDGAGETRGGR